MCAGGWTHCPSGLCEGGWGTPVHTHPKAVGQPRPSCGKCPRRDGPQWGGPGKAQHSLGGQLWRGPGWEEGLRETHGRGLCVGSPQARVLDAPSSWEPRLSSDTEAVSRTRGE